MAEPEAVGNLDSQASPPPPTMTKPIHVDATYVFVHARADCDVGRCRDDNRQLRIQNANEAPTADGTQRCLATLSWRKCKGTFECYSKRDEPIAPFVDFEEFVEPIRRKKSFVGYKSVPLSALEGDLANAESYKISYINAGLEQESDEPEDQSCTDDNGNGFLYVGFEWDEFLQSNPYGDVKLIGKKLPHGVQWETLSLSAGERKRLGIDDATEWDGSD